MNKVIINQENYWEEFCKSVNYDEAAEDKKLEEMFDGDVKAINLFLRVEIEKMLERANAVVDRLRAGDKMEAVH